MQFSDDCRSRALVLIEIANESPKFKEQALALAESWLTLANIHNRFCSNPRLIQDHSTAMTQTIDGVCLRLRGGRQVAREEHAPDAAAFTPSPTLPVIAQFLACPRGVR